jgi:hypothetical protein
MSPQTSANLKVLIHRCLRMEIHVVKLTTKREINFRCVCIVKMSRNDYLVLWKHYTPCLHVPNREIPITQKNMFPIVFPGFSFQTAKG